MYLIFYIYIYIQYIHILDTQYICISQDDPWLTSVVIILEAGASCFLDVGSLPAEPHGELTYPLVFHIAMDHGIL